MAEPKFSVVLIARNEAKKLPRLLDSLNDFRLRGGEVILVDTGSTDLTTDVAEALGCKVFKEGSRFRRTLSKLEADACNCKFVVQGEAPVTAPGESFFDFSSARNYAATLAKNDMVAMPDCDEIYTELDIDTIDKAVENGATQFNYDFIFSHDSKGRPDVAFEHSKFYNRRVLCWAGYVHEILTPLGSDKHVETRANDCRRLDAHVIKLEHWQNPEQHRGQYLTGLAWDCFEHPEKDRNSHYFARELLWSGRYRSAIIEFDRHIAMNAGFKAEACKSACFIAEAHEFYGEDAQAVSSYLRAINICGSVREPWAKLAAYHFRKKNFVQCATFATGGLAIPKIGFYFDRAHHFRGDLHCLAYWAFGWMGQKETALEHWRKALEFEPDDSRILNDAVFFLDLPKVTIIVPTLDRPESLKTLLELINNNANYPKYEVKVIQDSLDCRLGVVRAVNLGVDTSDTDLVMFLSDDCRPEPNFLIQAVLVHLRNPDHLVALNDGLWDGKLATHWLVDRRQREYFPTGEFFHPCFKHYGCDNYMTAHFQKRGKYSYAPLSRIKHEHPEDRCSRVAEETKAEDRNTLRGLLAAGNLVDPV